jgi:hypothetical protein
MSFRPKGEIPITVLLFLSWLEKSQFQPLLFLLIAAFQGFLRAALVEMTWTFVSFRAQGGIPENVSGERIT